MTMEMMVATRNRHKLEEIRSILRFPGLELSSLLDYPDLPDVDEDGQTFEANAVKKAVEVAKALGRWALADDSGLEVDALGGAPGVYSARYAGEPVSYEANNQKLLKELGDSERRSGRFRCVMALSDPLGKAETVEGSCEGRILHVSRGVAGFGYDPLFVPEGHTQTFAEMDAALKNRISHRARALEMAVRAWSGVFRSGPAGWDQGLRREPGPET